MIKKEIKPVIHTRADARRDGIEIDEKGNIICEVFRKPDARYRYVKGGKKRIIDKDK